jgi:sulfur carrier protein
MIKVTYRDQHWEVRGQITVRELIQQVGLDPRTVLAVRHGKLAFDKELLGEDEEIKLIAVISGG